MEDIHVGMCESHGHLVLKFSSSSLIFILHRIDDDNDDDDDHIVAAAAAFDELAVGHIVTKKNIVS